MVLKCKEFLWSPIKEAVICLSPGRKPSSLGLLTGAVFIVEFEDLEVGGVVLTVRIFPSVMTLEVISSIG